MKLFKLFPVLPDLKGMSDEDLVAALDTHVGIARAIGSKDEAIMASVEQDEDIAVDEKANALIATLEAGVADIERIRSEMSDRAEGAKAFDDRIAELTADLGEDEAKADEPTDGDEPAADAAADAPADEPAADAPAEAAAEVVAEAEAATEAAVEAPVVAAAPRLSMPRPSRRHAPLPDVDENRRFPLVASAGLSSVREGEPIDRLTLADEMLKRHKRLSAMQGGVREEVVIASVSWEYPEDRVLDPRDSFDIRQGRIDAVTSEEAIIAAGGLCAPVTPYYELANVSVADRPVRDSLAAFQAVRGGLNFAAPPVLGDVTTAISYITEEEDAQGGTFATKTCQVVTCPDFSEVDVAIIAHCLQFGNLGSRAFPEQVAQFTDLTMAAVARVADTKLLDGISAASTQVTAATATYGYPGIGGLLSEILTAAAGMRSRNRMADGVRLRWIGPAWLKQWLISDLANSQFDRFSRDEAGVVALLRELGNIEPTFTLDGETGQAQVYGAQTAGALLAFPSTVRWYMHPEGSFLYLDGGELNLGIVRDSVLNAQNNFQIFGEFFENVAFIGVEAIAVTSTICPAGTTGGPADTLLC